jgi:3-deoxy-7-phosphoheptulonate synthase
VHNVESALEYAKLLAAYAEKAQDDLHIVMRVYFEKPRTTVGWKGLINDPDLNGTFQINRGLRLARTVLLDIAKLGLPAGCEFLDTISPQYTADLVSWGAIGARTTESQVHRELTSALSMPTGFKNSTDGSVGISIDACRAARSGHVFLSVGKEGLSSIIETAVSAPFASLARYLGIWHLAFCVWGGGGSARLMILLSNASASSAFLASQREETKVF